VFIDAGAQLPLQDVLEVLVDRQFDRIAGGRRALFPRGTGFAPGIDLQNETAVSASDPRVVRRLDPGKALVVDAYETERVR
jgi:hypothetical protein